MLLVLVFTARAAMLARS